MTGEFDPIFAALALKPTLQQTARLSAYLDLLQRWNAAYNLTSVRDRAGMVTQHIADCLAVVPALRAQVPSGRVLDVGSGGGLPGVVLAVLIPDMAVTCVDSVGKKVAFVRQVAGALDLANLHATHSRIEQLQDGVFDVVVSRAFASLVDFVTLTRAHRAASGVWLAMKGRPPTDEIAALPPDIEVFHVEPLTVPGLMDAQRCLVWMRDRKAC